MSIAELYETPESLSALALDTNYPTRCLRFQLVDLIPSHQREYGGGLVRTLFGRMKLPSAEQPSPPVLRLHFFDEWAAAVSFLEVGDLLILKGFRLLKFPTANDLAAVTPHTVRTGGSSPSSTEERGFFIVPLPTVSVARGIQRSPDTGVTTEVRVDAASLEEVIVRVLPTQPTTSFQFSSDVK